MPRPELGELTEDQRVIVVRSPNDQRRCTPKERYIPARIVKASRVWIEMERADLQPSQLGHRTWRMRRDTQDEATDYSGRNARFVTLEQHAWEEARRWGREVLDSNGIQLVTGSPWREREAELADLIVKGRKDDA